MDPLRIVAPGDSYEPSAARENAWTEAARWVRERQLNSNRTPMAGLAGTTVLVKNQSGSDRDQFEILAVDDHLVTPADNLKEFQRRIGLAGKTPAAQHAGQFVVLAQPIKADSIGPAFASGAVAVKIKMVSESHPYWVPTQLAAGGQITRQTVEQQFGVSDRTAKRELSELCDWGMIEFDRSRHPGWYRLKYLAPLSRGRTQKQVRAATRTVGGGRPSGAVPRDPATDLTAETAASCAEVTVDASEGVRRAIQQWSRSVSSGRGERSRTSGWDLQGVAGGSEGASYSGICLVDRPRFSKMVNNAYDGCQQSVYPGHLRIISGRVTRGN